MKVLVYSSHAYEIESTYKKAKNLQFTFLPDKLMLDSARLANGYDAVALFTGDVASAEVVKALAECGVKYITTRSVGYDHIDLAAAARHGIAVANVPAYSPYSVSEHGIALLLALIRKLMLGRELFAKQDFRLDTLVGFDLHGKTVGIVGCGRIGMNYARILQGFGCRCIAYDILPNQTEVSIQFVSFREVLRQSDVVILSCPLNKETRHLVGLKELLQMKKEAILINTARGSIVDTKALLEVMEDGHLGGAGLDVYEYEHGLYFSDHSAKPHKDSLLERLLLLPNVLMTAHQGFLTSDALHGIATTTIQNLNEWNASGQCQNTIIY